jgi:molybdenum cofactor cytidylyltransferase
MRAQTVDVSNASGRMLCCSVFRPGGKKLLPKGHRLSEQDVLLLQSEGMDQIWVTLLDEGEVGEDEAVLAVASALGCGSIEVRAAAGGRANVFALEESCLLVDEDLLRQVNCASSVVIATAPNFQFIRAAERVATVKSAPFAVSCEDLDAPLSILKARGPVLQARPVQTPSVAVLYSDPFSGARARQLFETVMRQRLEKFGLSPDFALATVEEDEAVTHALLHLLRARPTLILVASTTAPAGPGDVIGRAMAAAGCDLERFLAPVEPGNLMLLGYRDDVPVLSAPGCFRSARTNIVDLLLPPLLSRYRVSGWEIASLGHGGLLC